MHSEISEIAERFMQALINAENSGDVEPVVELFSDEAELSNLIFTEPLTGRDGIRRFWLDYLNEFQQIASHFVSVIKNDTSVVLEWESEGMVKTGEPIKYRGVTLLKIESGKIRNFRAYYDSAVFVSKEARSVSQRN